MPRTLIAIMNQRIVAIASTVEELLENSRKRGLRRMLIVAVPSGEFANIL